MSISALAGLFLIAHGLVHVAVWVAEPKDDAPFDPRRSWLIGDARRPARRGAIGACVLLVVAGALTLAGAAVPAVTVAGATVSLVLVLVTFNRWLLAAVAINVAIVAVTLA